MTKIESLEKSLSNLKKEVEDLHPHLRALFEKLNCIEYVEYTHGPNEQGADFILTKRNDLIGQTDYVGVIVKNKNISQKSFDEIVRQIDECIKVKRHIKNGIHHIRMDEIWVISNGNISKNTKEKIHEIHKTGIKFFDRKNLASLMEKNDYIISDDLPTNISICLSKQSSLADILKSQSIGLGTLEAGNIFINQNVIREDPLQYTQQGTKPHTKRRKKPGKSKEISIRYAIENSNALILQGEPGSGKSKILQNVLSDYASEAQYRKTKIIPVFSTCEEVLKQHDRKIGKLIDDFREEHDLMNSDSEHHYMVIIDSVDECGLSRNERINIMKKWKGETSQNKIEKIIFASRDYIEEKTLRIPTYRVANLSQKEILRTIRKHLSNLDAVDRIIEDLHHSDIFRSLPQNPLATIILISLLKDENARHELPANLTELFAKYTECSLGRWDTNISERIKQKRYEATDKILTRIASYMIDNKLTKINETEARNHFKEYLTERHLGIDPDDLFDGLINRSNLVYSNNGIFQFRHRTIAEFFYSKNFSDQKIEKLGDNIFDVQWITILFFYVGLKKDCPPVLKKINSIAPHHDSAKIMKAINMANILLAAYMTPYLHIQKILQSIFIEISEYLENVFEKKIQESALSKFSIMRALFFFRLIMEYKYSRPFFKQAIKDSLIEIEKSNIPNNVKATSLFLLNIAYRDLGGENIFTGMIQKLGNEIPTHIALAINHEAEIMEHVSGDLKKFRRTVKRSLLSTTKRGPLENDSISFLYTKEIRHLPRSNPDNKD